MTRGEGSAERLREQEAGLPVTTYRPVLHGDFHNYIEDHYMKTFIGSPVKQSFLSKKTVDIVRVGRCGKGGCREVHSLRQQDNGSIDVYYGGTGGDYSKEKHVSFTSEGCRGPERDYGVRVSCVTRKNNFWSWEDTSCNLGSKNNSMHSLRQNCATGVSYICSMKWKQTDGKEGCYTDTTLIRPKVHKAHNFDTNEQGTFFAVVDEEEEDKNLNNESVKTKENKAGSRCSRVVRLYSNKSNDPIATYRKTNFFPTDVCFYDENGLLIADWMNDCVHVTKISDNSITFMRYLPGSDDIVRPTALNLDPNGRLLIGCGDGWVFRLPVILTDFFSSLGPIRFNVRIFQSVLPNWVFFNYYLNSVTPEYKNILTISNNVKVKTQTT